MAPSDLNEWTQDSDNAAIKTVCHKKYAGSSIRISWETQSFPVTNAAEMAIDVLLPLMANTDGWIH